MSLSNDPHLLEVRQVSKRFPGVLALERVNLNLMRGEVLALMGENGAGKSTLMKILAGVQQPDDGQILLDGRPVEIDSVQTAMRLGIALIHQELNLADNLNVAANIYLGREPRKLGFVDRKQIERDAAQRLHEVGMDVSPRTLVSSLSIGQQQLVEIAKALSVDARVLIMDEPTSSLSQHETETLFRVVRTLRSRGVSIVYISHRMAEVRELADRVVVLRDGRNAGELPRGEIDHDRMVRLMVGRQIDRNAQRLSHDPGAPLLEVENLVVPKWPQSRLNLQVRAGEVVGIAGLVGAGRTELFQVLFGIDPALGGTVRVAGKQLVRHTPLEAINAGMGLVPEDRKQQGLILEMSVRHNIGLAGLWRHRFGGAFLNHAVERNTSREMVTAMNIKVAGDGQRVGTLSGGNQQKVVIGKWLAMKPRVLLLDEPTRGIDVGAKQEIYQLIHQLAADGVAVLFISSELEEILRIADRAYVMHEGRITGQLRRDELSEEAIMHLATGQKQRELAGAH